MANKRGPYSSPAQAERRLRILRATLELLDREGIAGITIKRVAAIAEVGEKTVHNIFGSRDGLLLKAVALELDDIQNSDVILDQEPGIPQILSFTEAIMAKFREKPALMANIISIIFRSDDDVSTSQKRVQRMRQFAYAALNAANNKEELVPGTDINVLADLIAANQWGSAFMWERELLSLEQFTHQAMVDHCVTLLPFCVGARKQWLQHQLERLLGSTPNRPPVKIPRRASEHEASE